MNSWCNPILNQFYSCLSCYTARLWFHLAGLRYLYNKSVRLEQKLCTGRYSASLQWAVKPDYYQLQIFDLGIISKITHLLLRLSGRTHLTLISLMTSFQTNKLKGLQLYNLHFASNIDLWTCAQISLFINKSNINMLLTINWQQKEFFFSNRIQIFFASNLLRENSLNDSTENPCLNGFTVGYTVQVTKFNCFNC